MVIFISKYAVETFRWSCPIFKCHVETFRWSSLFPSTPSKRFDGHSQFPSALSKRFGAGRQIRPFQPGERTRLAGNDRNGSGGGRPGPLTGCLPAGSQPRDWMRGGFPAGVVPRHETWPCRAGFPAGRFWGLSSPQLVQRAESPLHRQSGKAALRGSWSQYAVRETFFLLMNTSSLLN